MRNHRNLPLARRLLLGIIFLSIQYFGAAFATRLPNENSNLSLIDPTKISEADQMDNVSQMESEKLYSEFQKNWHMPPGWEFRQMVNGGSDSGGGQGIYDLKTRKVRFLDVLTSEELSQIVPSAFPEKLVFEQSANCTRYITYGLSHWNRVYGYVLGDVQKRLQPFFDDNVWGLLTLRDSMNWPAEEMTSFMLPQLRDATRVSPDYQIQAAYYENGTTYIQKQVVDLMPRNEVVGLYIKELLRSWLQNLHMKTTNKELEQITRIIYFGDTEAFKKTTIYQKLLMIPDPVKSYAPDEENNIRGYLVKANNEALSVKERKRYQQEINRIKFQIEYRRYHHELSLSQGPLRQSAYKIAIEDRKKGILPSWMPQNIKPIIGYVNSKTHGWDITSGDIIFGLSCSELEPSSLREPCNPFSDLSCWFK